MFDWVLNTSLFSIKGKKEQMPLHLNCIILQKRVHLNQFFLFDKPIPEQNAISYNHPDTWSRIPSSFKKHIKSK